MSSWGEPGAGAGEGDWLISSTKAAPCCSAFDFSFLSTAISSSALRAFAEIGSELGLPSVEIFMWLVSADASDICSQLFTRKEIDRAVGSNLAFVNIFWSVPVETIRHP